MRTSAVALLVALLLAPQVSYGWKGGPWSNYSLESTGTNGTYKATFTGDNLLGVTTFGSTPTSEDTGRYFCWIEGKTSYGTTEVVVDHEMGRVSGVFLPAQSTTPYLAAGDTTTVNNYTDTSTSNNLATGSFVAETTHNDSQYVFKGTGHMTMAIGSAQRYLFAIATSGGSIQIQIIGVDPGAWVYDVENGTEIDVPPAEFQNFKFTITGVRTSTQPYTPVTNIQQPSAGGGGS